MKFRDSVFATLLFGIIFIAVYLIHNRFFTVNVVFYAAIGDAVIAVIISAVILFFVKVFVSLTVFEKGLLTVVWILLGYSFAISVPAVIDRSLSFYILEKLQQRGGGIKQDSFQYVFVNEYMKEHRLVDVRLTEQLESGTIKIEHGCVLLTPKGSRMAMLSRWYRLNILPKKRLLMGEYSDDLTDPFRNSAPPPDYTCR